MPALAEGALERQTSGSGDDERVSMELMETSTGLDIDPKSFTMDVSICMTPQTLL